MEVGWMAVTKTIGTGAKTPSKLAVAWNATKKFGGMAVLAGGLMLLPAARAHAAEKTTTHIAAKTFVRSYDDGKKTGAGAGLEASVDFGKRLSVGGSLSIVDEKGKTKTDESGIWVYAPITKKISAVGYEYTDLYFNVDKPAYGLVLSGYGAKVGYERGVDFTALYVKKPLERITPGATALFWDGKMQKAAISMKISSKMAGLPLTTELQYGKMLRGGHGSVSARVSVAIPLK